MLCTGWVWPLLIIGSAPLVFTESLRTNVDLKNASATMPDANMAESLRGFVARTVDGSSHSLARKLLLAEVSSRCSLGLLKFTRAIRNLEPWAFRRESSTFSGLVVFYQIGNTWNLILFSCNTSLSTPCMSMLWFVLFTNTVCGGA